MKTIFRLYSMINYAGILAVILLTITFLLGILDLDFKLHKAFAIATICVAGLHGLLILYRMIRMKRAESLFK